MSGWKEQPEFKARIDKFVAKEIREVAFKIFRGVVSRTPVDTGRLKGNWQVGFSSAPSGEVDRNDKTPQGAYSQSIYKTEFAKFKNIEKPEASIWIVNNLPYAVPIENGHGGRNPGVMVGATVSTLEGLGII